jgi:hypothetical protein
MRGLGGQVLRRIKYGVLILVLLMAGILTYIPQPTQAVGGNMMLFWDPANGSVPAGWCLLSIYDGYFPMGETPANVVTNWGTTFPTASRPYTPTSSSVNYSNATGPLSSGSGSNIASINHSSSSTISYGAESNGEVAPNTNLAAYRSLQLMMYGSSAGGGNCTGNGVPNVIPAHAIALFDTSVPAGWTAITAQHGRLLRANSTVESKGSDSETFTVTIGTFSSSGAVGSNAFIANAGAATSSHTHNPPSTLTCTSGCSSNCTLQGSAGATNTFSCTNVNGVPPYIQPRIAEANADASTLSVDITAMFDADPGSGWVVRSNSSGTNPYYQRFVRPNSTVNLANNLGTSTHSTSLSGTSGSALGGTIQTLALGSTSAPVGHTHTTTISTNTVSNVPPYFQVVFAEKVSFTLTAFQWYFNNDLQTETDAWPSGSLNVAQNAQIPAIPAQYIPPVDNDKLRLRVKITVSTGQAMPLNSISFKLQYSQGTASSNCTSGSWSDVDDNASSNGRAWRYGFISGLTDGAQLTTSLLTSTQRENYYQSASTGAGFTNPAAAAAGDTVEYDWIIQDHSANTGSQYNFRVVENGGVLDSGTLLSVYTTCPSLVTRPGTDQLLRHGEFFQDGSDQGFIWVD